MLAGMPSSSVPYPLRMSAELRERLKEMARAHDQSLHAEIISILQAATGNQETLVPLDVNALAKALADELTETLPPRLAAKLRESS